MKKHLTILALLLCTALTALTALAGGKSGWDDDYDKGLAQAKTESKMVMLDFTGSDWCGWCIKLDKEVFLQKAFKDYAKANLVLVEVDFPQGKHQTKKLKEQNDKLAKDYNIEGYPTIVVLNAKGEKIGRLGYMEGGPEAFIAELEKLKGK